MIIKMAIADSNEEYLQRLLNVFEEYEELNLSIYTEKYALETALASKKFDIVLFDASLYDGQTAINRSSLAIMLMDESQGVPENCRDIPKINKYQRISRIYQQILALYAEVCKETGNVLGQRSVSMIAFYSPVGGAGKTTLSLVAASKLAMQGYSTFYLNLEDVASDECYLPQNKEKGLSEIAAILGTDVKVSMKIQSLLQSKAENFYYVNHFDSPNDIYEMKGEKLTELLNQVGKSGLFDYVIVDMGVEMNERLQSIFEEVHKIVLVDKPDVISVAKMNRFLSQAHIINNYGKKMCRLLNFDNGRGTEAATDIPRIGRIGVAQNMDSGQLISMLASNSGVNFVGELM